MVQKLPALNGVPEYNATHTWARSVRNALCPSVFLSNGNYPFFTHWPYQHHTTITQDPPSFLCGKLLSHLYGDLL